MCKLDRGDMVRELAHLMRLNLTDTKKFILIQAMKFIRPQYNWKSV